MAEEAWPHELAAKRASALAKLAGSRLGVDKLAWEKEKFGKELGIDKFSEITKRGKQLSDHQKWQRELAFKIEKWKKDSVGKLSTIQKLNFVPYHKKFSEQLEKTGSRFNVFDVESDLNTIGFSPALANLSKTQREAFFSGPESQATPAVKKGASYGTFWQWGEALMGKIQRGAQEMSEPKAKEAALEYLALVRQAFSRIRDFARTKERMSDADAIRIAGILPSILQSGPERATHMYASNQGLGQQIGELYRQYEGFSNAYSKMPPEVYKFSRQQISSNVTRYLDKVYKSFVTLGKSEHFRKAMTPELRTQIASIAKAREDWMALLQGGISDDELQSFMRTSAAMKLFRGS